MQNDPGLGAPANFQNNSVAYHKPVKPHKLGGYSR